MHKRREFQNRWSKESFEFQMANIGSEVYRTLKYEKTNPRRFKVFYNSALELFDFTIAAMQEKKEYAKLKEVCRAREEFCDYFNGNSFHTDPAKMQRYYDQFVSLIR